MILLQQDILAFQTLGNSYANNMKAPDSENLWNNMSKDAHTVKNPKPMYIDQKHPYNVLIHQLKKTLSNTCLWT